MLSISTDRAFQKGDLSLIIVALKLGYLTLLEDFAILPFGHPVGPSPHEIGRGPTFAERRRQQEPGLFELSFLKVGKKSGGDIRDFVRDLTRLSGGGCLRREVRGARYRGASKRKP